MFPSGELIPSADASGNRTHPQETLLNVNLHIMCLYTVTLVIANDKHIFLWGLCRYIWFNIPVLTLSSMRVSNNEMRDVRRQQLGANRGQFGQRLRLPNDLYLRQTATFNANFLLHKLLLITFIFRNIYGCELGTIDFQSFIERY